MRLSDRVRGAGAERGSMMWALMVSMALLALGTIFTASVITTVQRSKASTDAAMLVQYTDTAVADAIAVLNAGDAVSSTMADATVSCEKIASRSMCYRYWALPVPGNALDPVRYDLMTRVWIDQDGDSLEPDGGLLVRSERMPLEVITFQTAGALAPVVGDGYVSYNPTPSGLFANAIHSFATTNLEGDGLTVRSYNSATTLTGTGSGVVSSSGWVSYGHNTQADSTVLYGGSSTAGDHTSRCTGEACAESATRVITATYATPTPESTAWMHTVGATACATFTDGDYVTSEHGGQLPVGTACINGSLIVDTATTTNAASPLTTLYVYGTVQIQDTLNAPLTGQLASPASLVIYSSGGSVAFAAPDSSAVSAMIYAPMATCGNSPGTTTHMTYFGSLVCGTVSLAGEWEQLYDEAAIASYVDPVPGVAKTFAPGIASTVDFDKFLVPDGWNTNLNSCSLASPATATGYWHLDEAGGVLARDSAGNGLAGGWKDTLAAGRATGVCGSAASSRSGGAVVGSTSRTATTGLSLEYWGKSLVGTSVSMAGVKVNHDDIRHVSVTVGSGATVRLGFSVENYDQWHLYTVSVSAAGTVTLYVDGAAKATGTSAALPSSTSGSLTIGAGTGVIDEVVYYGAPLTVTEVATRWSTLLTIMGAKFTTHVAGVPFSVPGAVVDGGSAPTLLKVNWTKPTGDFPTGDPTVSYRIDRSTTLGGTYTPLGTALSTATAFWQANPASGGFYFRVCAIYNGDTKCSTGTYILTLPIAAAPAVTVTNITTTTATFAWAAVTYAATYESQYRVNGGSWYGSGGVVGGVINHGAGLSITHGPTTQGNLIEVRVRAVNIAGTSAWSAVGSASLSMDIPQANGWDTSSSYPSLSARLKYSAGPMCPAGTLIQSEMRDQVTNWGGSWNGYGGWATGTDGSWSAPWMTSTVASYDVGANQLQTIRCYNPGSGKAGPGWGEHGPIGLWHPIPNPWGVWAGITSWRVAGWGATCTGGTTASYQWQVVAATFNTGVQGWTFGTSWANTGQAWGSGNVWVTARCEASGRYSGTVGASGGFW